ncbi:MAG: hypothetical protein PHQ43_08225 [Dehalococcoidales bacterium]|nr:hypothetical protein [Dehalococcoidales bacterium]
MAYGLEGRFFWLLKSLCAKREIGGEAEIDRQLNYWENKDAIEAKFGVCLSGEQDERWQRDYERYAMDRFGAMI